MTEQWQQKGGVLAMGFGAAVAMWFVGYLGRLPGVGMPPPVLGIAFFTLTFGAGVLAGRYGSLRHGAAVGAVSALVNMLILGSLLQESPLGLWVVPGALAFSVILGVLGAGWGMKFPAKESPPWPAVFATVAACATFLLLGAGGVVTSTGSGLAVPDWPNSFGYNMFLYPMSRMTGGIYYEHAHRLFGSLVGLTTMVLAFVVQSLKLPRAAKGAAWGLLGLVVVQGVLGGLRVTGKLTLSANPEELSPSLALAVVHGVVGQGFFAGLAAFAAWLWRQAYAGSLRGDALVCGLAVPLVPLLVIQAGLGALQRHLTQGLLWHVLLAAGVVAVAVFAGVRAEEREKLRPLGRILLVVLALQLLLGLGAWWVTSLPTAGAGGVLVRTAHQTTGGLLLALAAVLSVWSWPAREG